MFKIQTLNKISGSGLSLFDSNYTISDSEQNPDGIIVRSASMLDMQFPKSLLGIARAGAGVNNIPVDRCSEEGIVVFNTPGANANAVKELVLSALFLSSRKISDGIEWTKTLADKGAEIPKLVEKGKSAFAGPEIAGKKLGVIGLGAIGVMVANTAYHLDMEIYGYDPYISVESAWKLSRAVKHAKDLKTIFEQCDYITVHVPLNNETKDTFNAAAFAQMKPGVRILNFSRGELVNNEDLKAALESGQVASYVTDFPCEEVLKMKNVIAIPHLGASTPESEDNCAAMSVEEIANFLETGNIRNSVNFPNVDLPRGGDTRICVIHKNIPNMLGQISTAFASAGINIENMINKSKKDYAYTIIDIDGDLPDDMNTKLSEISGVVRIRVIK